MDSVRLSSLSMKYQRFTLSGFEDMGIRKFEFVAKTQFLHHCYNFLATVRSCSLISSTSIKPNLSDFVSKVSNIFSLVNSVSIQ